MRLYILSEEHHNHLDCSGRRTSHRHVPGMGAVDAESSPYTTRQIASIHILNSPCERRQVGEDIAAQRLEITQQLERGLICHTTRFIDSKSRAQDRYERRHVDENIVSLCSISTRWWSSSRSTARHLTRRRLSRLITVPPRPPISHPPRPPTRWPPCAVF